eukprot:scaffold13464_cov70-Skeletonema_dohrnii-CCMP3373.AAC.1
MPIHEAKSMVSLSSMFVLSEYWTSEVGLHSSGKLRARGVQICEDLRKIVTDLNSAQREEHFKPIKA